MGHSAASADRAAHVPMSQRHSLAERIQASIGGLFSQCKDYFGIGGKVRREPIEDPEALRAFLSSRASFIAQTSLYGYLRTRAGTRYPVLFESDEFMVSMNIAKWHMWLACLSDVTVYAGGLLAQRGGLSPEAVRGLMEGLFDATLAETGSPAEAGAGFAEHAAQVRARISLTHWPAVGDDEGCFHESPAALVRWAPVLENLKRLDEEVVRNSVRFHWQDVRRELRRYLDAAAIAGSIADGPG